MRGRDSSGGVSRAISAYSDALGPRSPQSVSALRGLAATQALEGRYADAEKTLRDALDIAWGLRPESYAWLSLPDVFEQKLELPPPLEGNAYESDAERFPSSLRDAIAALEQGTMARAAFGDEVVDHYLNYGRTEQRLFDQVVTDWERKRLFERS